MRRTDRRIEALRATLDALHAEFHHPRYLDSDPLAFAHRYPDPADREVVALIAASFAFGNVVSIRSALDTILEPLGPHPAAILAEREPEHWSQHYRGFVYRWVRAEDLRVYLAWIGGALRARGTLGGLWGSLDDTSEPTILPTLQRWVQWMTTMPIDGLRQRRRWLRRADAEPSPLPSGAHLLLTAPEGRSSCKRMALFLRWVCRPADGIDLGLWDVSPARLLMPVDTHVMQAAGILGMTKRTVADLRTALEITESLRAVCPGDPVKYDFALTRPGIMKLREVWRSQARPQAAA